jgi:hypothetical protein
MGEGDTECAGRSSAPLAAAGPDAYMMGMSKSTGLKERQELQAKEGKVAWAEYQAQVAGTGAKIERLRAQRLAKLAAETTATPPKKVTTAARKKAS